MELPPLQFSNTAASRTGDLMSSFGNDASGFTVNFGNGNGTGSAAPSISQEVKTQLIVAAVVGLVALWLKKHKSF